MPKKRTPISDKERDSRAALISGREKSDAARQLAKILKKQKESPSTGPIKKLVVIGDGAIFFALRKTYNDVFTIVEDSPFSFALMIRGNQEHKAHRKYLDLFKKKNDFLQGRFSYKFGEK